MEKIKNKILSFFKNVKLSVNEKKDKKVIIILVVIILMLLLLLFFVFKTWFFVFTLVGIMLIYFFRIIISSITKGFTKIFYILLIVIYFILMFNMGLNSVIIKDSNVNISKQINYTKEFDLNNNLGKYKVELVTEKTSYTLKITITYDNKNLPSDFYWFPIESRAYEDQGVMVRNNDLMACFIHSDDEKIGIKYSAEFGPSWDTDENNNPILREFSTSTVTYKFPNIVLLKDIAKYDKISIFKFYAKEVGIKDVKIENSAEGAKSTSYVHKYENAYNLHPAMAAATINWADIFKEMGI
ncbi:MAG: hypothetical protein PHD15_05950 [Clostridia bacterium]|nr:hypothetical protein [Clostridia bacterium]MDD4387274.1 hypothetical protein [Clostridia bacterium]